MLGALLPPAHLLPNEARMPSSQVMHKWKSGELHSGSKHGPVVKNRKQAIAIMLSEKRNEEETGSADRPQRSRPVRRKRG